jgi:lysophospholipase L1-like esterase
MLAKAYRLLAAWLLLAGCLALPALAEDENPNPAAKPIAREGNKGWMARHEKLVARAKEGHVDVVFLGDSITQGWEGAGRKVWAATFAPLRATNFGIGGDQTGHVLWRITTGKELEPINPKLAVIMIGTNNVPAGHSPEQIAGAIKAIVEELRKQKPHMKVLLLGVFPRAGKRPDKEAALVAADQLQPKIKQIDDIIAKLDDGKMVFYKDIGKKFLDEEGGLPSANMPDYLHLSPKGYQIWADAIKEDVENLIK